METETTNTGPGNLSLPPTATLPFHPLVPLPPPRPLHMLTPNPYPFLLNQLPLSCLFGLLGSVARPVAVTQSSLGDETMETEQNFIQCLKPTAGTLDTLQLP